MGGKAVAFWGFGVASANLNVFIPQVVMGGVPGGLVIDSIPYVVTKHAFTPGVSHAGNKTGDVPPGGVLMTYMYAGVTVMGKGAAVLDQKKGASKVLGTDTGASVGQRVVMTKAVQKDVTTRLSK